MILINPASSDRLGIISRYIPITLPIGVGTLAGYLLSNGKQVKIIDELINPTETYINNMDDRLSGLKKPYLFGISCLTININRGFKIAKMLKSKYPDSIVIIGGIHPTSLPEESLNTGDVDIVVRREGEETLSLLYDAIKKGRNYADIAGISFKEGSQIIHNQDAPLIEDLDKVSKFPYQLFDPLKYAFGFLMTSRGCSYNCIFCSQRRVSGRKYRFQSNEIVIQSIDLLVNVYKQPFISFSDDDFLVSKERVKSLCNLIIKNKFHTKVKFACQTRANHINEEILGYLKEAGFTNIAIGMETGSERLMRIINKGETVKDNIEAVRLVKKAGFFTIASFLFGLPSETGKERFQSYMLAKGLKIDNLKFNNVMPYPGTELFEIAKKEGTLNIEENWKNFNSVGGVVSGIFSKFKIPYVPKDNTEIELKRDIIWANFYFYLSQITSVPKLLKGENPDWFSLSNRWYLKPLEYFHLMKLAALVIINVLFAFRPRWIIKEILWRLRDEKFDIE